MKVLGFVGFTITASGIALITGVDGQAFGIDVYGAGTLIIGIGLIYFLPLYCLQENFEPAS
ncbi:MAG: hypothetical protein AAF950_13800 [Pseudomonadota bacterium]